MRISDWSSDVCSSDLRDQSEQEHDRHQGQQHAQRLLADDIGEGLGGAVAPRLLALGADAGLPLLLVVGHQPLGLGYLPVFHPPDSAMVTAPAAALGFLDPAHAPLPHGSPLVRIVIAPLTLVQQQLASY